MIYSNSWELLAGSLPEEASLLFEDSSRAPSWASDALGLTPSADGEALGSMKLLLRAHACYFMRKSSCTLISLEEYSNPMSSKQRASHRGATHGSVLDEKRLLQLLLLLLLLLPLELLPGLCSGVLARVLGTCIEMDFVGVSWPTFCFLNIFGAYRKFVPHLRLAYHRTHGLAYHRTHPELAENCSASLANLPQNTSGAYRKAVQD